MKKLNIAIIGQGRSGKDIHGAYYLRESNLYYNVKYVVEEDRGRRELAEKIFSGCKTFGDYTDLFAQKDIDLVVNTSYSDMHYKITKELLERGMNVLVEKPFARSAYECGDLIRLAKKRGALLAVFQQTFFAPYYRHILQVIEEGKIGEILQASIKFRGFSRRWDWQTLQKRMGGNAYNTGPHPIGVALGILGFDDAAKVEFSKLFTTKMSSGDADDYCKILLSAPHRPVVDIEIDNTDAYSDTVVKLIGTKGTYRTNISSWEMKYIIEGENKERPVKETFISDESGAPVYCREQLNFHEEHGRFNGDAFSPGTDEFYKDLYFAITENRQLFVTPEMAQKIISVIETAHAENPLAIKY